MKKWLVSILIVLLPTLLIGCGKDDSAEGKKQIPNDGISQSVVSTIKENNTKESSEKKQSDEKKQNPEKKQSIEVKQEQKDSPKKEETKKEVNQAPIQEKKSSSSDKLQKKSNAPPKEDTKKNDVATTKKPESGTKDKYQTDPVPKDKPKPVEPGDSAVVPTKKLTTTISIVCDTILNNMDKFNQDKLSVLPKDGVIMAKRTVEFSQGESVLDVLKRETRASKIQMEMEFYPAYNSAYIEGINNIYEFDCGELSGWMYKVNGWFPNYGASRYELKDGDVIEWVYTCDLGRDVGGYVEGVENQ
jgi:hypothetical protein